MKSCYFLLKLFLHQVIIIFCLFLLTYLFNFSLRVTILNIFDESALLNKSRRFLLDNRRFPFRFPMFGRIHNDLDLLPGHFQLPASLPQLPLQLLILSSHQLKLLIHLANSSFASLQLLLVIFQHTPHLIYFLLVTGVVLLGQNSINIKFIQFRWEFLFLLSYFADLLAYGYDRLMDELLVPLFVDET